MVNATVIGARGYLGRELLRLLHNHPEIDTIQPVSTSNIGQTVEDVVPGLHGLDATFVDAFSNEALDTDVVFTATPAGAAIEALPEYEAAGIKTFIDLSRDHRHEALTGMDGWHFGLADLTPAPRGTARIANPGCYPTATALAMAPALQAGLVAPGTIIVDGKSGVSGAGVQARADLHFPEMNESSRAYKVLGHDHTAEMAGITGKFGEAHAIRFTPHLVPMTRGLLSTVYLPAVDTTVDDVKQAYATSLDSKPFVHFKAEANTGDVAGTNHAHVAVDYDPETNLIVARGAIDNLLKGGSGTAIQNMNDALGLPTALGLAPRNKIMVAEAF